mmetsp:Transcript_27866/g.50662  ORF Transcript_27866/g.50662 Transcript_27866/m.50662 type:complete len:247 (+) Transcript_27866:217-957(+)
MEPRRDGPRYCDVHRVWRLGRVNWGWVERFSPIIGGPRMPTISFHASRKRDGWHGPPVWDTGLNETVKRRRNGSKVCVSWAWNEGQKPLAVRLDGTDVGTNRHPLALTYPKNKNRVVLPIPTVSVAVVTAVLVAAVPAAYEVAFTAVPEADPLVRSDSVPVVDPWHPLPCAEAALKSHAPIPAANGPPSSPPLSSLKTPPPGRRMHKSCLGCRKRYIPLDVRRQPLSCWVGKMNFVSIMSRIGLGI